MGTPPFISSTTYSVNTVNNFTRINIPYLNYTGYLCGSLSVFIIHQQREKVNAIHGVYNKNPLTDFIVSARGWLAAYGSLFIASVIARDN